MGEAHHEGGHGHGYGAAEHKGEVHHEGGHGYGYGAAEHKGEVHHEGGKFSILSNKGLSISCS